MPPAILKAGNNSACVFCINVFKWFPVVFISCIVCWSYYAYVFHLCFYTIDNYFEKICFLLGYHITLFMFLWAYYQTIFSTPASVPKRFFLSHEEAERLEKEPNDSVQCQLLEQFARNLPVACRNNNGVIRYCEKCKAVKPDRAHHCSVCRVCVLKMDHHCPWVNNCVSFTNYKFFILFLGYAIVYCLYVALTTLPYFIRFWANEDTLEDSSFDNTAEGWGRLHILFLFFVAVMFAISLVSLFVYHCYLVTVNRTTLESFRPPIFRTGPDKNGFSLGRMANVYEVFGDNKKMWFLPVFTSLGDGITYKLRVPHNPQATDPPPTIGPYNSYHSMGQTDPPLSAQQQFEQQHPQNVQQQQMGVQHQQPTLDQQGQPTVSSMGDGVSFPQRYLDLDTDGLLSERQRWAETDEEAGQTDAEIDTNRLNTQSHPGELREVRVLRPSQQNATHNI